MYRTICYLIGIALLFVSMLGTPAHAQKVSKTGEQEPERIRGQIASVDDSSVVLKTKNGKKVNLKLLDYSSVLSLSKSSFTDVDFGVYVGSVSKRLDQYSPIVRDSLSWLHQGYELRVFDEELRGLALGHQKWDLTSESVMTHGWVDDLEIRVLSIKYGPTEEEETDVDVSRDVPILRLSVGDKSLLKPGAHVFAGAQKEEDGGYVAVFLMVGQDGIVPSL
ncbi:MAG: hypothetical protein NPINA01_08000 [Nitrospinaceae bacterium]|nr:MAG: hypothetical protein NPINA01_08000 [Nitrospinaceae bacterium]